MRFEGAGGLERVQPRLRLPHPTPAPMPSANALSRLALPDLIGAGRLAIENALAAPEIMAALAPAYTQADLEAARADLDALEAAAQAQTSRYGLQYGATDTVEAARRAFHDGTYMVHVATARLAFKSEPGTLARLGLKGERAEGFHAWAGQVRQFYTTLLGDAALAARMAAKGVTTADLTAARDAFEALAETERGQEDHKGLAQQSTRDRDALAEAFRDWLADFRDLARVRLRDNPDWLERLGFLARSEDE